MPVPTQEAPLVPGLRNDRIKHHMDSASIRLSMVDAEGNPLPLYLDRGYRVALGEPAQPYRLQITNLRDERVSVVVAIDGLNPSDSKPSFLRQSGYVLDPGQTITVSRMRSKKKPPRSLAFPVTHPQPLGSINLAVFREVMTYPYTMPWSFYEGKPGVGTLRNPGRHQTWLPPTGAGFRRLSTEPESIVPLFYGLLDDMVKAASNEH